MRRHGDESEERTDRADAQRRREVPLDEPHQQSGRHDDHERDRPVHIPDRDDEIAGDERGERTAPALSQPDEESPEPGDQGPGEQTGHPRGRVEIRGESRERRQGRAERRERGSSADCADEQVHPASSQYDRADLHDGGEHRSIRRRGREDTDEKDQRIEESPLAFGHQVAAGPHAGLEKGESPAQQRRAEVVPLPECSVDRVVDEVMSTIPEERKRSRDDDDNQRTDQPQGVVAQHAVSSHKPSVDDDQLLMDERVR